MKLLQNNTLFLRESILCGRSAEGRKKRIEKKGGKEGKKEREWHFPRLGVDFTRMQGYTSSFPKDRKLINKKEKKKKKKKRKRDEF